jgi:nicotinamide-nucleotide amidase
VSARARERTHRRRAPAAAPVSARAGIVVTGTEVLSGRVRDRNGPWLADRLAELGVELAHVTICGDRAEDMEAQLRFLGEQGVDLIVTSGGLGPTADDLTLEVVSAFTGRPLRLDPELERRIEAILQRLSRRWRRLDPEAMRVANRKQAMVPEGAEVIEPAGTAPGMVVPASDGRAPAVVVMPGPPRELHEMWPQAIRTEGFRAATRGGTEYEQRMLRLFGIPESEIAATLRAAEAEVPGFEELEITTCLRRGEVEAVIRSDAGTRAASRAVADLIADRHRHALFSVDGSSIDDQVAGLLAGRRIGVGESCSGGLMAARLTERAGSSGYVAGGVVAYSNQAKSELLGVEPGLIERYGAVSPEVAHAMADGALARFGADVGVSITGVAGPGGGSEAKPVGYVCWCVKEAGGGSLARDVQLPGDRAEVRDRSTTVAMHLVRRLLRGERSPI